MDRLQLTSIYKSTYIFLPTFVIFSISVVLSQKGKGEKTSVFSTGGQILNFTCSKQVLFH